MDEARLSDACEARRIGPAVARDRLPKELRAARATVAAAWHWSAANDALANGRARRVDLARDPERAAVGLKPSASASRICLREKRSAMSHLSKLRVR